MGRAKGYQDLDDSAVGPRPRPSSPAMPPPQEIEMASVSVVPDGRHSFFFITDSILGKNLEISTLARGKRRCKGGRGGGGPRGPPLPETLSF